MLACWLVVVSILVIPIASHNDKRLFQLSVVGRKLSAVSWNKKKCCRLLLIWKGTKCPFIWYGPSWDYKKSCLVSVIENQSRAWALPWFIMGPWVDVPWVNQETLVNNISHFLICILPVILLLWQTCCWCIIYGWGTTGFTGGVYPARGYSAIWRNLLTSRIQVYLDNFYLAIVGMQR